MKNYFIQVWQQFISFGIWVILLFIALRGNAQTEKPDVFISAKEMTQVGGDVLSSAFVWLDAANAYVTIDNVNFPTTGSYRCDISGKVTAGSPSFSVSIDGTSKGTVTFSTVAIEIKSLFISNISSGPHTVKIQATNFSYPGTYGYVGLIYFTQTSLTTPYVYPVITTTTLPTFNSEFLTKEHFGAGRLRGFSLGGNGTNGVGENDASMVAMAATGANIARCFVNVWRSTGGDTYVFGNSGTSSTNELAKLDSTIARGTRLGYYVVPCFEQDPVGNAQWGNATRKASIASLWVTLAKKYVNNKTVAAYDLWNEPRSNFNYAEVIKWQTQLIDSIRLYDANHVIAVECIKNDMFAMMLPLGYENIIYSPHGYSTLSITHQGVDAYLGSPDAGTNTRNPYPLTSSSANLTAPWDINNISAQHNDVRIMSNRFHVPIFVGEFSCINWAPASTTAGSWSSTEWVNDNITLLEAERWSWVYHNWNRGGEFAGWDPEIPSSYYVTQGFTYTNAAPFTSGTKPAGWGGSGTRSSTAPTIVMLKNWFALNPTSTCPTEGVTRPNTYYFSTLCGDDNRTSTQARNPTTPWKSISKLNSYFSSLSPGDSVLFHAGETFTGPITPSRSGNSSNSINFGYYGTGDKPIITSLQTITGIASIGNSKYQSSTQSSLLNTVKIFLMDGAPVAMGRYPNADASNGGYLAFESHSGSTTIIDNDLPASPDWDGATAVVRTADWILDPRTITSHVGTQITFNALTQTPNHDGNGYFIQNDPRTLDQHGEWYYNPSNKQFTIYQTSTGHTFQAASVSTLVTISSFNYLSFSNINFKGANDFGINISNATGITIKDCDFFFCGQQPVKSQGCTSLTIEGCYVKDMMGGGFYIDNTNSAIIRNNTVRDIAHFQGMQGLSSVISGDGLYIKGSDNLVEGNTFRWMGRSAINFRGDNLRITKNLIDSFDLTTSDHGGIYTVINAGNVTSNTAQIDSNTVLNGIGAPLGIGGTGTAKFSGTGIYIDVAGANNKIFGNTVAQCYKGIYSHFANNLEIRSNNLYNNRSYQVDIQMRQSDPSRNFIVKGNTFFTQGTSQKVLYISTDLNEADMQAFGVVDSNHYVHYNSTTTPFVTVTSLGTVNKNLTGWRNLGFDGKGDTLLVTTNSVFKDVYAIDHDTTFSLEGYTWIDGARRFFSKTHTLSPYTSVALVRGSLAGATPPVVSITSPSSGTTIASQTNITIQALAMDADGTISSVKFYQEGSLLGTDNSSPYSYTWTNVSAGDYTLTAEATDNSGLVTTSLPVVLHVTNTLPAISITAPLDGASYTTGATVTINANATDANGTISKVNFYVDGIFKGTDNSSPYSATWVSTVGGHALTAVAVDNLGDSTRSAVVNITASTTNVPPTISFTSPTNNATYLTTDIVNISVTTGDADGTVSRVNFYDGTTFIGTDVSSPYSMTKTFTAGVHNLYATSKDDAGDSTTAGPVKITVSAPPNIKPVVSITSPYDGENFTSPATFDINVDASDADGTIARVNFYLNGTFVATDASAPYSTTPSGITPGGYTYNVTAIDNDGDSTTSTSVTVIVIEAAPPDPDDLSANVVVTNPILCAGGSATVDVSATGGSGTYVSGTGTFAKAAGVYDFIVEDDAGTKDTVTLSISEPGALSATVSADTITVYGGTANKTITAIGGTMPYQYQLVTSAGAAAWTTNNVFKLGAGSYTVNVKDANGCTASVSFTLTQPVATCNCLIRGKKRVYK